jgi:glutathione S-transferase
MTISGSNDVPDFQKSIPTIHNLEHSQAIRVIWALEEIHAVNGLKFNVKNYPRVRPKNPDLLKVSPMGKSPILTVDDLDGKPVPNVQVVDGVLMETRLILNFIADNYGGKQLWEPETDEDKRRDIYFQEFACNSFLERVDQALIMEIIPMALGFPLKQILGLIFNPIANIFKDFQVEHYKHMESLLSDEKPYFAGKKLGIADFCMEFPLSLAVGRGYLDPKKYPKLKAYHERIVGREAYKRAIEQGGGQKKYDLITFGMG